MFVYLAHPIDFAGENSWLGSMLVDLSKLLAAARIGAFRPGSAYLANMDLDAHKAYIADMNNIAIHQADGLIAVLAADIPTLGTSVEIEFALSMKKPTLIFTDITRSVQVAAWSRRGAIIINMADPDFTWPTAETLGIWIDESAFMQGYLPKRKESPCLHTGSTLEVAAPPALLVSDDGAANLQPGKYQGDAGIDLAISESCLLEPGEFQYLPTGVHVAIPDGYFGWITGRSSTWRDYRCSVVTGVIDSGYRGELKIGLRNEDIEVVTFSAGTRLGQLILLPVFGGGIELVETLPDHERGTNGYGSSGV